MRTLAAAMAFIFIYWLYDYGTPKGTLSVDAPAIRPPAFRQMCSSGYAPDLSEILCDHLDPIDRVGCIAFKNERPIEANPYPEGSYDSWDWRMGWLEAKLEFWAQCPHPSHLKGLRHEVTP